MATFDREYFHKELFQLREWMGDCRFWAGNKPGNAIRGLLYVYANTDGLKESDVTLMTATLMEYDMRLAMCIGNGTYKPNASGQPRLAGTTKEDSP